MLRSVTQIISRLQRRPRGYRKVGMGGRGMKEGHEQGCVLHAARACDDVGWRPTGQEIQAHHSCRSWCWHNLLHRHAPSHRLCVAMRRTPDIFVSSCLPVLMFVLRRHAPLHCTLPTPPNKDFTFKISRALFHC